MSLRLICARNHIPIFHHASSSMPTDRGNKISHSTQTGRENCGPWHHFSSLLFSQASGPDCATQRVKTNLVSRGGKPAREPSLAKGKQARQSSLVSCNQRERQRILRSSQARPLSQYPLLTDAGRRFHTRSR